MDQILNELISDLDSNELNKLCVASGVCRPTVNAWLNYGRTPRIDLLRKIADASGYEIVLKPKELLPMRRQSPRAPADTDKLHIRVNGGRVEAWNRVKMVAYVDDDQLYGIDAAGYAVLIGSVNHRAEIIGKYRAWKA